MLWATHDLDLNSGLLAVSCSIRLPWALDICSPWLCWWLHKPASMTTSAIHWMAEMKTVLCMCCKRPRGSEKLSLLKVRGQVTSQLEQFSKDSVDFLTGNAGVGMHISLVPEATELMATKTLSQFWFVLRDSLWSMWSLSGPVRLGREADVDAAPAVTDWLGSQESSKTQQIPSKKKSQDARGIERTCLKPVFVSAFTRWMQ